MEIVIKPNSLGSSVMTEKMTYSGESVAAAHRLIRNILEYDSVALVQEYVFGTEYTIACLEKDNDVLVLPAIRIETETHFFGSKEKYVPGFSDEIIVPESEDTDLLRVAKQASQKIFVDVGARNAVRFDFIITDSKVYFLEANPFPGLTQGSLLPKMLRTKGWDVENLVSIYVENAQNHGKAKTEFVVKFTEEE
jgi:D-alanine-D-alanine ligase